MTQLATHDLATTHLATTHIAMHDLAMTHVHTAKPTTQLTLPYPQPTLDIHPRKKIPTTTS